MLRTAMDWPHAVAATKMLILDALKIAICGDAGCAIRCDYGQSHILAAARAAGEIP